MKRILNAMNAISARVARSRVLSFLVALAIACTLCVPTPAFAMADGTDPLTVIGNLSDYMFLIVQSIGVIAVLFGIVQLATALKGHDAAQRSTSLYVIAGGLIMALAKVVLQKIGVIAG